MVDPVSVLGTHLSELIRRHAYELFSRQDAKRLLDRVAIEHPKVVEDLVPKLLPLATVQRVCRICCASASPSATRFRFWKRWEKPRLHPQSRPAHRIRPAGAAADSGEAILNRIGELPAWFVDPGDRAGRGGGGGAWRTKQPSAIAPQTGRDIVNRVLSRVSSPEAPVVVITTTGARYFLRQMTEASAPNLFFLAHNEVPPGLRVQSLGTSWSPHAEIGRYDDCILSASDIGSEPKKRGHKA